MIPTPMPMTRIVGAEKILRKPLDRERILRDNTHTGQEKGHTMAFSQNLWNLREENNWEGYDPDEISMTEEEYQMWMAEEEAAAIEQFETEPLGWGFGGDERY